MRMLGFAFLVLLIPNIAWADNYKVIIQENYYSPTKKMTDLNSRYIAKVSVYINGKLVGDFRGSTLADNSIFYNLFELHNSPSSLINLPNQRRTLNDAKIEELLKRQESLSRITQPHKVSPNPCVHSSTLSNSIKMKDPLISLSKEILSKQLCGNYWPIIKSGKYQFQVGLHRNKKGLNLFGSIDYKKPYDPSAPEVSRLVPGGAIATINKNPNQKNRPLADAINIHWGQRNWRSNRTYKKGEVVRDDLLFSYRFTGSEGCITIAPDQWTKFIDLFPDKTDWKKGKHNGTLIIRR